MYHLPLKLLVGFSLTAVFICTIKFVDKRYRFCWGGMAALYLANTVNLLILATDDDTIIAISLYSAFNLLIAGLSFILYIVLFIQGNNQDIAIAASGSSIVSGPSTSLSMEEKTHQLFKLKELHDAGILSKEEFESEKEKILNK